MDRIADPALTIRAGEAEEGDRAARELLVRIYKEAVKAKRLDDMPLNARLYVHQIVQANGGKLPRSIGGRPRADHREFALAVAVEVERDHGRSFSAAVRAVALRASNAAMQTGKVGRPVSRRAAVEAAYDKWKDSRELGAEMDRRRKEAPGRLPEVDLSALAALEPGPLPKPPRVKLG